MTENKITTVSKPLTVARQDFLDEAIKLINNSGLPAFVIAEILSQILTSLNQQIPTQYEADLKAYQDALAMQTAEAQRQAVSTRQQQTKQNRR